MNGSVNSKALMAVALYTAIMNGCTMGVDQSLMSNLNIMDNFVGYFDLDSNWMGLFSAAINIGSVLAGAYSAQLCDHKKIGRKGGILISSILTIIGVIIQTAAVNRAMFFIGRIFVGQALVLNSVAAPTYVSELVMAKDRGLLCGLYMSAWYFAATLTGAIAIGIYQVDNSWSWRGLSLFQLAPSLLALPILPFIPESPRFLVYTGREDEAMDVLARYHANGNKDSEIVLLEYAEIKQVLSWEVENNTGWLDLFKTKGNRRRLAIVCCMGIFSQLSGSNIVGTYLGVFLDNAGVTKERTQLIINLCLTVVNLAAAVSGSYLTERWGRKAILVWSTVLMAVCLFLMGGLTKLYGEGGNSNGTNGLIFLAYLFSATYAFSYTPLCITYCVEVLNFSIRAKGMAISQAVCYAFGFLNQYAIPIGIEKIGYKFYLVNGCYNVAQIAVMVLLFVEIKGLSLEEVDAIFDGSVHYAETEIGKAIDIKEKPSDLESSGSEVDQIVIESKK